MAIIHETKPSKIKKLIETTKNVLVDVYADWCEPCKMLGTMLEKLAGQHDGKFTIIKVNSDKISRSSMEDILPFWKDVSSLGGIPVLVFFVDGKRVEKYIDNNLQDDEKPYGKGLFYGLPELQEIEDVLKSLRMI
jgi:thiol-disulfide isomerase/thioredoxin